MTGTRSLTHRGVTDGLRRKSPRLVLGLGRSDLAVALTAYFENLGWQVDNAPAGPEAGWLAHRRRATAVVLPWSQPGESGALTCAKLRVTHPGIRVILVGPEAPEHARQARYAGAVGYLPDTIEAIAIARAVLGS